MNGSMAPLPMFNLIGFGTITSSGGVNTSLGGVKSLSGIFTYHLRRLSNRRRLTPMSRMACLRITDLAAVSRIADTSENVRNSKLEGCMTRAVWLSAIFEDSGML